MKDMHKPTSHFNRMRPHELRHWQHGSMAMLLYVVLVFAGFWILRQYREVLPIALQALLAVMPVAAILWYYKIYFRYFIECDELERLIEMYGIVIGTLLVGVIYLCLGFLALAQLIHLNGPLLACFMLPSVSVAYVAGKAVGRRQHL